MSESTKVPACAVFGYHFGDILKKEPDNNTQQNVNIAPKTELKELNKVPACALIGYHFGDYPSTR